MLEAPELRSRLDLICDIPELQTLNRLLGGSSELFLVGGAVRDVALGGECKDVDVATALRPQEVLKILLSENLRVVETGVEHGTVLVVFPELHVEVTTFRQPSVRSSTAYSDDIVTDLSGRDFTINAIAYGLTSRTLIDPWRGLDDLNQNVLKAVGRAEDRFREDPLRILRMVRFGPADFRQVGDATSQAAMANAPDVKKVSRERVRVELEHILTGLAPAEGLRYLDVLGLLNEYFPSLTDSQGIDQNEFHVEDVFYHTLSVVTRTPPDLTLRLAALFHDLGKPGTVSVDEAGRRHFYKHELLSEEICRKTLQALGFSNHLTDDVAKLVRHHMRPFDCGPAGVRRILRDTDPLYDKWRTLKIADAPPAVPEEEFRRQLQSFDDMVVAERERLQGAACARLEVDGSDLLKLGMKEGRELGKLLKELNELVIDDPEKNHREWLLEFVRAQLSDLGNT